MTVVVNGMERDIPAGATVDDIVSDLELSGKRGVAVARNGDLVLRAEWPATRIEPGDRIEVLHAVQGG